MSWLGFVVPLRKGALKPVISQYSPEPKILTGGTQFLSFGVFFDPVLDFNVFFFYEITPSQMQHPCKVLKLKQEGRTVYTLLLLDELIIYFLLSSSEASPQSSSTL